MAETPDSIALTAECVKCGWNNPFDSAACGRCQWPLTLEEWQGHPPTLKRITIDTCCINERQQVDDLNLIEHWAEEGKFVIERASAMLDELTGLQLEKAQAIEQHRAGWVFGLSRMGIDTYLSGPDLKPELTRTLFPTTASLSPNQSKDVEHLRSHVLSGPDAFITNNPKDFIRHTKHDRRKQEEFRRFGIWVFTPAEFVHLCRAAYRWV